MSERRRAASLKIADDEPGEDLSWVPASRAGRPTLDELERRKSKVMQVATSLFVHDGYAATSLVDIAKGAGVATRTVYQHFGDKEAIFRHVMFAPDTGAVFAPPAMQAHESLLDGLFATSGCCQSALTINGYPRLQPGL